MENWKVITFANKYEVSNKGRIRNRTTRKVLKPYIGGSHKNPQIFLCCGVFGREQHTISQIVFNHFCLRDGERPTYYGSNGYNVKNNRIGHFDGNKLNNNSNNLYRY